MRILKSFAAAGAVVVATAVCASAADLLPPPPLPPEPIAVVDYSGWYLRGDVGVGYQSSGKWTHTDVSAAPGGRFISDSINGTAFAGVGVGYQFNSWFRADVTGEWRAASGVGAIDRYDFTCFFVSGSCGALGQVLTRNNIWSGNHSAAVFLLNGYVDFGTWNRITPFIGAGIGTAYHRTFGVYDFDPGEFGGAGMTSGATNWSLAWALQAGLAYNLKDNLRFEIAYRYLNMGDAKIGKISCLPACGGLNGTGEIQNIDSHEIKLGMRWLFNEPVPYRPIIAKN